MIVICGSYCSGKNYFINKLNDNKLLNLNEFIHSDLDDVRYKIPEYNELVSKTKTMWNISTLTNKEAGYIVELIQKHALFQGYNLLINSSLKDHEWYYSYFTWINNTFPSYTAKLFYMQASVQDILKRNLIRGQNEGRIIPYETLKNSCENSQKSFEKIKCHPLFQYDYNELQSSCSLDLEPYNWNYKCDLSDVDCRYFDENGNIKQHQYKQIKKMLDQ